MTITGTITKDKGTYKLVVTKYFQKHNKKTTIVTTFMNFESPNNAITFFKHIHPEGKIKSL